MDMEKYGTAAALVKGEHYTPSYDGPVVYFTAPGNTIDGALKRAEEQHVKIVLPKMNIGENGFIAMIEDSEGNRIAIHSMKE